MEKKVIDFSVFLQEADIKGNIGIPGEDPKKPGDSKYLSDVERRAGERSDEITSRLDPEMMGQYISVAQRLQRPHKKELEKLAKEVILEYYGSILANVDLDIRFAEEGEGKKMMKDVKEKPEKADLPALEELKDRNIIDEIERRKIGKNLVQGAGKNTILILNLDETYNGLVRIMGEDKAKEYSDVLNKIITLSNFYDWAVPEREQLRYWVAGDPSGVSDIKFNPEDVDSDVQNEFLDSLKKGDEEEAEDLQEEILDDLESAKIIAIGKDYAMLIHEAVKGIWNLTLSASIPAEADTARIVISNTDTLLDELQDLRYGPFIENDFSKFVLEFESMAPGVPNLKERLFGKLITMQPASDFLKFFYAFLNGFVLGNKSDLTQAEGVVKKFVKEIKEEWENYEEALRKYEESSREYDEYKGYSDEEDGDTEIDEPIQGPVDSEKEVVKDEEYYSKLTKAEMDKEINKAIDDEDYETLKMLSKYIKESFRN